MLTPFFSLAFPPFVFWGLSLQQRGPGVCLRSSNTHLFISASASPTRVNSGRRAAPSSASGMRGCARVRAGFSVACSPRTYRYQYSPWQHRSPSLTPKPSTPSTLVHSRASGPPLSTQTATNDSRLRLSPPFFSCESASRRKGADFVHRSGAVSGARCRSVARFSDLPADAKPGPGRPF